MVQTLYPAVRMVDQGLKIPLQGRSAPLNPAALPVHLGSIARHDASKPVRQQQPHILGARWPAHGSLRGLLLGHRRDRREFGQGVDTVEVEPAAFNCGFDVRGVRRLYLSGFESWRE